MGKSSRLIYFLIMETLRTYYPLMLLTLALLVAVVFSEQQGNQFKADPYFTDPQNAYRVEWNKVKDMMDPKKPNEAAEKFMSLMRNGNPVALSSYLPCFSYFEFVEQKRPDYCPNINEEYPDLVQANTRLPKKFKQLVLAYSYYLGKGKLKNWKQSAEILNEVGVFIDSDLNPELFWDPEVEGFLLELFALYQEQAAKGIGRPISVQKVFQLSAAIALSVLGPYNGHLRFGKIYTTEFEGIWKPDNKSIPNTMFGIHHRQFWVVINGRQKKDIDANPYYQSIIPFLRVLAEEGHPSAMVFLGNLYAQGLGVKKDAAKALGLYYAATDGALNASVKLEHWFGGNGGEGEVRRLENQLSVEQNLEAQSFAADYVAAIKSRDGRGLAK